MASFPGLRLAVVLLALVMVGSFFAVVVTAQGTLPAAVPTVSVRSTESPGAPDLGSGSGSVSTSASTPSTGSHLSTDQARANLVKNARQAFINNGVSLTNFLPPNLNAAPGPTSMTGNHIVPLYDYAAAPLGISTLGLENTTGTTTPYILNTTSLEGTFSTTDPQGLQALSPYYGTLQAYGDQLNTVLNGTTILGDPAYDYWLQNVITYNTATNTLSFENNIWNFSSPSGIFPSNSILHGLGHVEEDEVYEEGGPSMSISYPFTLDLYLNTTVGSYDGSPQVNEVYFNYTVLNGQGQVVCPTTEPTGEKCGMYDNVYFNSGVNVAPGSAEISANGYQYTPIGLPSDMEFDVGIGQSDGANANVVYANATVGLYVLNPNTGQYQAPPSAYDFGSETGETGVGAFTTWNTVSGQPVAYLRTGPSLLVGLWGVDGGTDGAPTIGSTTAGPLALDYAGVAPDNAFVAIAQGIGVTNQSFFQVAPTFGWFSGKGEIGPNIWLPQGVYTVEVMLSGYYQVNLNIYLHYNHQPLTVTLSRSLVPTVYTPLWAYSASDLANLSTSGAGTPGNPYVLVGDQTGSLAPVFAILNDYLFIVYSGVWVNATTAYFEFNPPPSLEITEPSWWYFQTETLAYSYGGTLPYNQLPMYFYHTANMVVEHGTDIGLWSSDIEVGHDYAVYCNVCTDSLFASNTFNVSSEGLDFLGTGVAPNGGLGTNYVWGNTFAPFSLPGEDTGNPADAYGGMSLPSTGLSVSQSGDSIYNNAFYTNGTASSTASGRGGSGCSGCTFTNSWNVTGGYQSAANSITVNGVALTGSILGQSIQGGNFWFNYGTVADPYGVPYTARATSPTGTSAIAKGGDLAPLSTYLNVAQAPTVPTALGVGLNSVTFTESGLSTGNSWTMRIVGVPVYEPLSETTLFTNPTNTTTVSSTAKTSVLWVPNGTYAWYVSSSPSGAAASGGTVTVNGAPVAITVAFKTAPVAGLSPSTATTQVGGSVPYTVTISGGLPPITWTLQSNQPGSPANFSASTFVASHTGSWTVYLNATDSAGRTSRATASVTVEPALVATLSPGTATTQVGASVVFVASTAGGVAPVHWTLQSNEPGSPANLSAETFAATAAGSWTVYLNATDAVGSVSDVTATVTVEPALVANLSPGTATTQVGGSVSYTVGTTGGVAPITWTLQSNEPGSPSNLSGSSFSATEAGTWTVYLNATDSVGSVSDTTATVTVEPALVATLTPTTASMQLGGSLVFGVATTGGVAPVTWTLQSNEPGSPSNLSGRTFTPTQTGVWTVYLNATDAVGSTSGAISTVTVGPAATFAVTFSESGLPAGLSWSVTVGGTTQSLTTNGGTDSLVFSEPNGTYTYSVAGNKGWHQSTLPYRGDVTVADRAVSEPTLAYSAETYSVTFSEKGLPSGLTWTVTLNGVEQSLTTTGGTDSLTWSGLLNGTYSYSIAGNPGWHESSLAYSGTVTVKGKALTETLQYKETTYSVTFSESGLPAGLTWKVTVDGVTKSVKTNGGTDSLTWTGLVNNTYAYSIHSVKGWTQSTLPPSGTVVVDGASVTEPTIVYS
jgi:thermopsin